MEYRTVSTKLPSNELTMFRSHCVKKGVSPAFLMRKLILSELELQVPQTVAGLNYISYDKNSDTFNWSIALDTGTIVEVLSKISPDFIQNLQDKLSVCLNDRKTFIRKTRKESVAIPSEMLEGKHH